LVNSFSWFTLVLLPLICCLLPAAATTMLQHHQEFILLHLRAAGTELSHAAHFRG